MKMHLTGFADEAANDLDGQIKAVQALGWSHIECRNIDGKNLTAITDDEFDVVCEKLQKAGISINCFGSGVANWAKPITDPPDSSYQELKIAIPRMHRLGTKMIRVMSFHVPEDDSINDPDVVKEVIKRMKVLTAMAEDAGITLVHENCDNWGGRSYEHTLRLLDAIPSPNFKLVFDTGNPVFRMDVRGKPPYQRQDSLEFYRNVRDHVVYIHIKDGIMKNDVTEFTYPGEGDGHVVEVCSDLFQRGYDGAFSIEPHLAVVFHDKSVQSKDDIRFANFVEYGKRMEKLLISVGYQFMK